MNYNSYYQICQHFMYYYDKNKLPLKSNSHGKYYTVTPTRQENSKGTLQMTGIQMAFFKLGMGEPIMTRKFVSPLKAIGELKWLLSTSRSIEILNKHGIKWWDPYLSDGKHYTLKYGKIYGLQLTSFFSKIAAQRYSRNHLLFMMDENSTAKSVLPPCITQVQLLIQPDANGKRDIGTLIVTQRSADIFLGLPYDILEYQLFAMSLAKYFNFNPYKLVFNIGSAHVYLEHLPIICKMLTYPTKETSPSYKLQCIDFPVNPTWYEALKHLQETWGVKSFDYSYYNKLGCPKLQADYFP